MANREGDRAVLAAMAAAGSNLAKPAHTLHYLYFKSLAAAESAASELRKVGFSQITVGRSPTSVFKRLFGAKQYSCIAETRAVPSEANVFAVTDLMEGIASRLDGEYDGWQASIEK